MKYIKQLVGVFVAAVLFTTVATAATTNAPATDNLDKWSITLAGGGNTTTRGDSTSVGGIQLGLGHTAKLILPAEIGIRQGIDYSSQTGGSDVGFTTKAYADLQIVRLGNIEFDAGGNLGAQYGNTTLNWEISPEVVGRIYLKKDVDVFARAEYPFALAQKTTSENNLTYTLGVRVQF